MLPLQAFQSPRLEVRSKKDSSFKTLSYLVRNLSRKSLTDFFIHLIRRYWFTKGPGKPGRGERGWQCLDKAHCLPYEKERSFRDEEVRDE